MAVRENVTITYRGARYEFGHGQNFYGIWAIGSPGPQPLEWWPQTPAGWAGAWSRFNGIEGPGTIVPTGQPAPQPAAAQAPAPYAFAAQGYGGQPHGGQPYGGQPYGSQAFTGPSPAGPGPAFASPAPAPPRAGTLAAAGPRRIVAAGLLAIGVVLGIAGLFPVYLGTSLTAAAFNWVPHLIYLAAWAASAVGIMLGGDRARIGTLLGLGTSIVTFGLFFADAGEQIAGGSKLGTGLVLGLTGWAFCAAGSVVAFRFRPDGTLVRPRGFEIGGAAMVALAALGAAIAFAPSWDSFTLQSGAGTRTFTQGDAFTNPGIVIAGDVAVMVALVLVAILAALWRPGRLGAALLAGAIVPMAAQAISAIIQVAQSGNAFNFFGITPGQASAAGVRISSGVTTAFWLYGAFVLVMIVLCARMLTMPSAAVAAAGAAPSPLA
ncbi:MAG TPA: hypothetical protein VGI74_10650, partial [Streptosporangiaceae bacterium]